MQISPYIAFPNEKAQNLEIQLKSAKGEERFKLLYKLADEYSNKNPQKAVAYAKEALELIRNELKDIDKKKQYEMTVLNKLSWEYLSIGEYQLALDCGKESGEIAKKMGDAIGLALAYNQLGAVYSEYGNLDHSLQYYLLALSISEKYKGEIEESALLNNIAIIYTDLGDYKKALEFFNRALAISREAKDQNGISSALNNIGTIYQDAGDSKTALDYFQRSLDVSKNTDKKLDHAIAMNNIGEAYSNLGSFPLALDYLNKALIISKEIEDKWGIANTLKNIATVKRMQKRISEASANIEEALQIAQKLGSKDLERDIYLEMALLNAIRGNHKKERQYLLKHKSITNNIFNKNKSKRIAELQTKYDSAEKEREILILKKEKVQKELALNKLYITRTILISSSVLLVIIVVLLINRYRLKVRSNKEIKQKKMEITNAHEELKEAHRELAAAMMELKTLGGLLPMCAHCKKIRDDSGYWQQVEKYIETHSDVEFSHGICPDCYKELYPEMYEKRMKRKIRGKEQESLDPPLP